MTYFLTGTVVLTAASVIWADAPRDSGDPRGSDSPVNVGYDLAALSPERALPLNGMRAVFRIEVIDRPRPGFYPEGTSPYPWCRCCDPAVDYFALAYVELPTKVRTKTVMTVVATLKVLHYRGEGGFPDRYYFVLSEAKACQ